MLRRKPEPERRSERQVKGLIEIDIYGWITSKSIVYSSWTAVVKARVEFFDRNSLIYQHVPVVALLVVVA